MTSSQRRSYTVDGETFTIVKAGRYLGELCGGISGKFYNRWNAILIIGATTKPDGHVYLPESDGIEVAAKRLIGYEPAVGMGGEL